MPRFSIVVPVYNVEKYLEECLSSIHNQTFKDWEAVLVNDGSTDSSQKIIDEFVAKDNRFVSLVMENNGGRHLARKKGMAATRGEYVLSVDADDEIVPELLSKLNAVALSTDADVIHYGLKAIPENGTPEQFANEFADYVNQDVPKLVGVEILRVAFDSNHEYHQDWNVVNRMYEGDLARESFASMVDDRLNRAEDAYEYFVIASRARKESTVNEIVGYQYHLGRGIMNFNEVSRTVFMNGARQFYECMDQITKYAGDQSDAIREIANRASKRLFMNLMDDWANKLAEEDRIDALDDLAAVFGVNAVSKQVFRLVRDYAYATYSNEACRHDIKELVYWYNWCRELLTNSDDLAFDEELIDYSEKAHNHLEDVLSKTRAEECAVQIDKWTNQDMRIFVSAHKEFASFDSDILQMVQVGAELASSKLSGMFHDDEGDNISYLNKMLCEVTAQYWAWKNIDAKYIGFCHYRRYFNFSVNKYKENPYGEIIDGYIDGYSQQKYGLLDENMRPVIENYDLIHSPVYDLRTMPGKFSTPYEQYDAAPKLHIEDLEACAAITKQMYPEYAEDVDSYLQGHKSSFCNMYIMKKDLFDEYADWLFPILMKCIETADYTNYSVESLRTPGHLAERLFNIWLVHQNRVNQSLKSAELQVVHFDHPEKQDFRSHDIAPHSEKAVIPVVFAADNNYVPMVSTTIQSMLDNASRSYEYRIYVMQKDIAYENQELMRSMVARFPNAKIEFLSVDAIIDRYKLTTNNPHISVETYYRFLIQDLLPAYEKVLYLDSDLIVSGDVSVLYKTDLGDNLLAAARDIDYLGNLNMKDGKRLKYNEEILHMVNPYDYFQAGVLVLNTKAMRELMPMTRWLQIASNDEYIYNDQDVLNAACEGRVTYLDFSWNVMIDCAGRIGKVFSFAPADIYNAYLDSRRHELITHYAGFEKPWSMVGCDRSELYWQYARETPFYENLIGLMSGSSKKVSRSNMPPKAIGENNPIRKVVDPLMPLGTRRREVVKAVGRAVRGRTE